RVGRSGSLRRRWRLRRLGLTTMWGRFFRHLATDHGSARRAFPPPALSRIETAIAQGEGHHRGQVRVAIETSLPLVRVLKGLTPRARALEAFSELSVWETEEDCRVLVC